MTHASPTRSPELQDGFTILELVITLTIAAILIVIAVPNFNEIIKDNRLSTQINSLSASVNLARSEAVKRNLPVTLCQSSDGSSCAAGWAASSNGWVVFVNSNNDNSLDATEEIVRVGSPLSGDSLLSYSAGILTFTPQGDSPNFSGTFILCDDRGAEKARGLVILPSGLVRLAVDTNNDDIVEDINGNNIACS